MSIDYPGDVIGQSFDGWKILSELGRGNSAYVFRANKDDNFAAVKVFSPELTEQYGEADQLRRIRRQLGLREKNHPSLVNIFSGGKHSETGYLYITMEIVAGITLDRVLNHIRVERIGPLIEQIAGAAEFLEQNELVHRDIKPANIVISKDHRRATLLDLGVVRPLPVSVPVADTQDLTDKGSSIGRFLGTIRYSPHEFLYRTEEESRDGWRAVTFYQLGAVLYDMITGRRIFDFSDAEWPKLVEAVRHSEPDLSPERLRDGVPRRLVELAQRSLQKKWRARIDSTSWDSFRFPRGVRSPVVVFVYAGGTIGAVKSHSDRRVRGLRPIESEKDSLLRAFEARLRRDYDHLAGPDTPLPFDLKWEFLPRNQQVLSENANCRTWNELAESVEKVFVQYSPPDQSGEQLTKYYLAGVVVLHGTDTLAYSAAALSLSLRNLPCPVLLTGSNQPPNELNIFEQDLLGSRSDAYRNILQCLRFIQCFGHRITEVFVCFGDTVHPGINVRKVPIDSSPYAKNPSLRTLQEPFHYRNQGPQRRYAYRFIEQLICNNFYPLSTGLTYDLFLHDPKNLHRHVRESPHVTNRALRRSWLAPGVRLISISPGGSDSESLPELDLSRLAGAKIVLLEAYSSGTFPTHPNHPFTRVIEELFDRAIPLAMVSRSGLVPSLEHYEMSLIRKRELPVIRIFGMIAETAEPFLSIILGSVSDDDWCPTALSEGSYELLLHRHNLLRSRIGRRQEDYAGILNALLGDVLDPYEQYRRAGGEPWDATKHLGLVKDLFVEAKGNVPKGLGLGREKEKKFDASKIVFLREHFLWMLLEIIRPFELARCGPDAMACLVEMGFTWGDYVCDALVSPEDRTVVDGLFLDQRRDQQDTLVETVRRHIRMITRFLFRYGVADIRAEINLATTERQPRPKAYGLSLQVEAKKHGRGSRSDELYAVLGYEKEEAEFFRVLREGADARLYESECNRENLKRYRELFRRSWERRPSPLDWFLIGLYKAAFCSALRYLRFDRWVERCSGEEDVQIELLRQSVPVSVRVADKNNLAFDLRYCARRISKESVL